MGGRSCARRRSSQTTRATTAMAPTMGKRKIPATPRTEEVDGEPRPRLEADTLRDPPRDTLPEAGLQDSLPEAGPR
jgi:hypothetical protein